MDRKVWRDQKARRDGQLRQARERRKRLLRRLRQEKTTLPSVARPIRLAERQAEKRPAPKAKKPGLFSKLKKIFSREEK